MPYSKVYTDPECFALENLRKKCQVVKDKKKNIGRVCAGFDIETTRIGERSYMYHWQFSWNDVVILGRKWEQFEYLCRLLDLFAKRNKVELVIWVANLGYEFSYIGRRFPWKRIFATDSHHPLVVQYENLQFREALDISGQGGLRQLAKNFCQTQKLVGDLDYEIIRNSLTPLQQAEIQYCINDVVILSEFAEWIFSTFSDKHKDIPMTATGIIRSEVREAAAKTGKLKEIRKAIRDMFPDDKDDYNYIMRFLFRGGYTHANVWYAMMDLDCIIGADLKSSYPGSMLHEKYPMTPFVFTRLENDGKEITDSRLDTMAVWMEIVFEGISRRTMHAVESEHKIIAMRNARFDNGRLYKADAIQVLLTEQDYDIYKHFYKWDKITILRAFTAFKQPLPNYLLIPMMRAYMGKEQLSAQNMKDTIEYKTQKAKVNSTFGMCCTRLRFDSWRFDQDTGEWKKDPPKRTYYQMISNQILSPFWGIWITAYSRHRLLVDTIYQMDPEPSINHVAYCDTDSVYFVDTETGREVIDRFNRPLLDQNRQELPDEFRNIGCFEWIDEVRDENGKKTGEPLRYRFKTLGAKRYIKRINDDIEVTCAGMIKNSLHRKLLHSFRRSERELWYEEKDDDGKITVSGWLDPDEMFEQFDESLMLTVEESLKNMCSYEPLDHEDLVTDADGRSEIMHEMSSATILPTSFKIKMIDYYFLLMKQVLDERRLPVEN